MKNSLRLFGLIPALLFSFFNATACKTKTATENNEQAKVIETINKAENYIKKYGKEKAIIEFRKNSDDIFMADYKGNFYVSPLHPELIGHNQFNYKDPSGALVVQEEINKAKTGGGWLKGRLRKDSKTEKFVCRKIYICPILGDYLIGSWYHYAPTKQGTCLI